MKSRRIILSVFSLFLSLAFLIGSTGITIIIHKCPACGDFSVSSGIFLPATEPLDNCCEYADKHCYTYVSGLADAFKDTCCHFHIEKIKFTNYTPVVKFTISASADILVADYNFQTNSPVSIKTNNLTIHNKHGGRSIVKYNCQYLT